ncbi:MAG TPA: hypothetical protein VF627_05170 [Abditibacterium sp.]
MATKLRPHQQAASSRFSVGRLRNKPRAELKTNRQSRYFGARLFLFDRTTGERTLVPSNIFEPGTQMMWSPDGKKLVLLQSSYNTKTAQGTARISTIDVE